MSRLAEIEFQSDRPVVTGKSTKLWLNGLDITNCVTSFELKTAVGAVNTAKIEVLVGSVKLGGKRIKVDVRDLLADFQPDYQRVRTIRESIWRKWASQ